MKTSFSQMFGEALGRVLDKGDFVEGEHPRGHGGKFTRKMGATERAPAYSLKKYKAGGGTSYRMYVGRKLVGHISGFEEDKKIDGTWTPVFHIYRAFMDEGMRGKGMYRSAVQVVANQYTGGAYVHSWEASGDLKRALGKLPTHRIDEENERIRVLPEGEKPKEEPKEPPKRVGRDYDTAQVFMDTIGQKHPGATVLFFPLEDGTIELVTISIPEGERSGGKGSAVMRDITDLADSKGVTLVLKVAEAKEVGEENRARLFEFYKRFGFVLNDEEKYNKRNSDMYREPVKPKSEVSNFEAKIRGNRDQEHAMAIGPDGAVVFETGGQKTFVDISEDAARKMRGGVLTHNHPTGRTLSRGDFQFAADYGLREMRVVTPGATFSIQIPKTVKGWNKREDGGPPVDILNPNYSPTPSQIYSEAEYVVNEEGNSRLAAGKPLEQVLDWVVEETASRFADMVGWKYKKESLGDSKVSKEGTPEGAVKGWETRRRGGPPIPLKGYFLSAKTRIKDLAQESVDELKQEIENNRRRIATPYMDMIRRDDARRRQGYEIVREAAQRLADIQPHPDDAEKRAMLLQYAEQRAEKVSQRDGEKSWDEEFSDYLTAAGEIAERAVSRVH